MAMLLSAHGMLAGGPSIDWAGANSTNRDILYLCLSGGYRPAGISTNAGVSFEPIDRALIPQLVTTNLDFGLRRYVLVVSELLLRSDDGGTTWTNTGARSFLRKQANNEVAEARNSFWKEFTRRFPERSAVWHGLFAVFSFSYVCGLAVVLRKEHGWLAVAETALRGLVVLGLLWCMLVGFHAWVNWQAAAQWLAAYWNTSLYFEPSGKTALVMWIAAKPWALFVYLCAMGFVLPGSPRLFCAVCRSATPHRLQDCRFYSIVASTMVLLFHVKILFVGYW